jgi:hypothetical protein
LDEPWVVRETEKLILEQCRAERKGIGRFVKLHRSREISRSAPAHSRDRRLIWKPLAGTRFAPTVPMVMMVYNQPDLSAINMETAYRRCRLGDRRERCRTGGDRWRVEPA